MEDPEIRPAQVSDKKNILSVIGSYHFKWDKPIAKRYYDDYFSDKSALVKGDKVYVLASGKKVIGFIGYSIDRYETLNHWKALMFYRDNGFRLKGVIKDYYRKGENQIILSKSL